MKTKLVVAALGLSLGELVSLPATETPLSNYTPDKVGTCIGILQDKEGAASKETGATACDYRDLIHGVSAFVNVYQSSSVPDYKGEFPESGTYE